MASSRNFFGNILWLNIRRLKRDIFWRALLVLINFMLFFTAMMPVTTVFMQYVFLLVTLANTLFIYTRFQANIPTISIMMALGASPFFILIDRTVEMLMGLALSSILFFLSIFFIKPVSSFWKIILYQFGLMVILTPLLSAVMLRQAEFKKKER